ncbi:MAG: hypothetical protein FWG58_03445 [Methanomassiliicoccaceae archaeon]|nr:hypothetical protein [Methanomassiliicoccaceae archaeon]
MGLKELFEANRKKYAALSMIAKRGSSGAEYGNTQLGIAMNKAVSTINAKEKAGKMSEVNAKAFRGRVDGLKALIGVDEDSGLLQVAQMIGAINRSL